MAYRLCFNLDGDIRRRLLVTGENLVGSDSACDIRISHPSVSKHHAAIVVVAGRDEVEIADLGSRNGTRIDQSRLRGKAPLVLGQRFAFGSVSAFLETVSEGDTRRSEIDLKAEGNRLEDSGEWTVSPTTISPTTISHTTASLGPLSIFMQGYLPELAAAVAEGMQGHVVAARVGAAVLEALPCRSVEIRRTGGGPTDEILFSGESAKPGSHRQEISMGDVVIETELPDGDTHRLLRPLLETLAALVLAATRHSVNHRPNLRERTPARDSRPAQIPDPPSVEPAVKRLYERARKVARGDVNVLILGESGTGKELLARFLHDASPRRDLPFVAMNCAALAKDLQESELFGIERGVATGVDARPGLFEKAHGGTLFLDEIGDMALEVQAQILRALQQKEVFRVGSAVARPADVRVISATHQDVVGSLDSGGFRRDLFHRIADWQAHLPPLRERPGDISNLAAYFLRQAAARLDHTAAGISQAALDALRRYHWPGNIRQLEREIGRALLFAEHGELLDSECLSTEVRAALEKASPMTFKSQLEQAERQAIERALDIAQGSVPMAAASLDVPVSTLYRKLKELEIR